MANILRTVVEVCIDRIGRKMYREYGSCQSLNRASARRSDDVHLIGFIINGADVFVHLLGCICHSVSDSFHIALNGRDRRLQIVGNITDQLLALLVIAGAFPRRYSLRRSRISSKVLTSAVRSHRHCPYPHPM